MPKVIAWLRDANAYADAVLRVATYVDRHSMGLTAQDVVQNLLATTIAQRRSHFLTINSWSVADLVNVPDSAFCARLATTLATRCKSEGKPSYSIEDRLAALAIIARQTPERTPIRYRVADPISLWRRNYRLDEFFFPNVQDSIFAVYRCIQKRDPMAAEYNACRQKLRNDQVCPERDITELLGGLSAAL